MEAIPQSRFPFPEYVKFTAKLSYHGGGGGGGRGGFKEV